MPAPIEEYALIGDTHTAALVSKAGSVDWLCVPRFDSPACFAALLGTPEHGRFLLAPGMEPRRVARRYREGTLVLETDYETADGLATVVDTMPPREQAPALVRLVHGRRGRIPMRMELTVRFGYGQFAPWIRRSAGDLLAVSGPDALRLSTPVETRNDGACQTAEFVVTEGEQVPFVLTWFPSHEPEPPHLDPFYLISDAERWWRAWSERCTYEGEWREAVVRSLITLKALTYAPTGGVVAAPTTSLPAQLGGVRNWDYRYCWLRDAAFTLAALRQGGYEQEALAWQQWLLRAVAGESEAIQIVYGPAGERRLDEWQADWLPGYEGATPVRIGNAAARQFQLDVYGELADLLHPVVQEGGFDPGHKELTRSALEYLESAWSQPDQGIWEVRGPRLHFTHSKVMAWVAFDRGVKAIQELGLDGPLDRWRRARDEIHAQVCRDGFDSDRNTFVQSYGSPELDASLLKIPLVGFLPATDPRVAGTVDAIQRELSLQNGLILRYSPHAQEALDGLPEGEGAFLACSFWLVDSLALLGRLGEARALFERLLSLRNDLGLLSEQYDPRADRLTGNFPQAISHVALVNSAYLLSTTAASPRDDPDHRRRQKLENEALARSVKAG
jgi:GH15 family glucan-1,4-alpha-glucosidase